MDRLKEISELLSNIKDKDSIEKFFKSILTQKEISDISSRWELVKLLEQGFSQRSIAKKLGISLCKITRGSKELKKKGSIFKTFIDLHKKRQRC